MSAHICRVCLEKGIIPIFGNEKYNNVSEDLIALAGIQVLEDDEYPKYLCQSCNCLLQSAIKLKATAQYSDQILHKGSLHREKTSSRDTKYYTKQNLKTVITDNMLRYKKIENKISKTGSEKSTPIKPNTNIKLNYHDGSLTRRKPLTEIKCRICHIVFGTASEYKLHMQSEHKMFKEACPICNKEYSPSYLKYHLVYHKKGVKHICDVCGKDFIRKGQLVQHLRTHFFELPFKCPQCPYRGRDNHNLKLHQRSHTTNVKHPCPHCPKQCTTKSNLTKHMLIHKSELDFKCEECQKGFYRKTDLEQHFKSEHMGIKDHICDVCGKAFGLRRQMMKHTLYVHKRPKLLNGRTPLYILAERQNKREVNNST